MMQELPTKARITIRRHDAFLYTVTIGAVVAFGAAIASMWPLSTGATSAGVAMILALLAFAYLDGPVAYVRVTRSRVTVANVFGVHHIPRHQVVGVGGYENLEVKLRLADDRRVPITAYEPSLNRWGGSRRSYVRHGRQLERAMEAVPMDHDNGGTYRWRPRYQSYLVSAAGIAVLAFAYFWGVPNA